MDRKIVPYEHYVTFCQYVKYPSYQTNRFFPTFSKLIWMAYSAVLGGVSETTTN